MSRHEWPSLKEQYSNSRSAWGESNYQRPTKGLGKHRKAAVAKDWWQQPGWQGEPEGEPPEPPASLSSPPVAWSAGEASKGLEAEADADADESCNVWVAEKAFSATKALESFRQFILRQQLDSFARSEYLNSSPYKSCFIEEKKRLLLNLPASCPCACRFHFEEALDQPGSLQARRKLASKFLTKLLQEGFIGDDLQRSTDKFNLKPHYPISPWQDIISTGGEELRIRLSSSSWKDKVSLYVIKTDIIKSQIGFLSHVAANFCYHIKCQGHVVVFEAYQVSWDGNKSDLVEEFNEQLLSGYQTSTDLRLVQVSDKSIDFEGMEEFCKEQAKLDHMPLLCEIAWKLDRLSWWETVRKMAPTEPGPSPLKLHIIFDCEDKESRETREALAVVGEDALRLAAAVACSEENPAWPGEQLDRQVQEFLNKELLAELVVRSKMLQYGERKNIGVNEASEMLLALIGSHKLESDMFAIARLWTWLTGDDVLQKASLHTAGCPRFLGRTPSYIELSETEPFDDSDPGIAWLKVRYEDYDDGIYRWNGHRAEEFRPGIPGSTWQPLVWDAVLATFCSPSMLLSDGRHRPLPNKVCAWLRGRPINKLVSIKHTIDATPSYTILREEVDELLGEKNTWLLVKYVEQDGHVAYRRSTDGGLGYEIFQMEGEASKTRRLGYSESKKTLLSQALPGWSLPRKVVTWLLEPRCLADLIPGRRKVGADTKLTCEGGKASWTSTTTAKDYTIRTEPVSVGVIYTVRVGDSDEWQAITYSEEQKEWLVDGGIQEVVPSEALTYLSQEVTKMTSGEHVEGQPVDFMVPRGNTPQSVRLFFPQLSGTGLAELEQALEHRFRTPRLLAEALTHCSAKRTLTASCEHLAIVGHAAVCSFTSDYILRSKAVPWFAGALINKNEEMENLLGGTWPTGSSWSGSRNSWAQPHKPLDISFNDFQSMKGCHLACCNHTSFAFSCVKMGLHKAINPTPTGELKEAIEKFAAKVDCVVCRRPDSVPRLLQGGAPKVLGDVFLACIGAVIMDSDHTEVEGLLEMHVNDCFVFTSIIKQGEHSMQRISDIRDDMFDKILAAHSPTTAIHSHIVMDSFSTLGKKDDLDNLRSLLCCTDVALVEVNLELYLATTPRAALVTALANEDDGQCPGEGPIYDQEPHEDPVKTDDKTEQSQILPPPEHDGAIYCRHCEMWLNGPTQWADHEIGKKHRKAVRRTQVAIQSGAPVEAFAEKEIKAVPEGFGKKPKEMSTPEQPKSEQSWEEDPPYRRQYKGISTGDDEKITSEVQNRAKFWDRDGEPSYRSRYQADAVDDHEESELASMSAQSVSQPGGSSSTAGYTEGMFSAENHTWDAGLSLSQRQTSWQNNAAQAYYAVYQDRSTGEMVQGLVMPERLLPQFQHFTQHQ